MKAQKFAIPLSMFVALLSLFAVICLKQYFYENGRNDGLNEKLEVAMESLDKAIDRKYKGKSFINRYVKSIKIEGSQIEYALDNKFDDLEEFNQTVKDINVKGIEILSRVHDLNAEDRKILFGIYDTLHTKTIQNEFAAFEQLKNDKYLPSSESVIERQYYNTSKALSEYLAGNTCTVVANVFSLASITGKNIELASLMLSQPCKILTEALIKPFEDELISLGLGKDYDVALHKIKDHVRSSILELSTVSDNQISVQHVTKEAGSWLGKVVTGQARMDVSYVGRVKAGCKLDRFLEIKMDHENEKLQVFLPAIQILSTEVYTDIESLVDDWSGFIEIDPQTINSYQQIAREDIQNKSINNGIYEDARENAVHYLRTLLLPFYALPDREYGLELYFDGKLHEKKKSEGTILERQTTQG